MFSSKLYFLISVLCTITFQVVENKSIFGIGQRVKGDQLLVKDVLSARSFGLEFGYLVKFNYDIKEPITYIEIHSEENVYAEVHFSYRDDIVQGTVSAVNSSDVPKPKPFEVLIQIFGFSETIKNPDVTLIRSQNYQGMMVPFANEDRDYEDEYNDNDNENYNEELDANTEPEDDSDDILESTQILDNFNIEDVDDIENEFEDMDKIIEIGKRQKDDYLLYDTFQTSAATTEIPASHSVIFYYIDSPSITYVKFIIFDHFSDKVTNNAEYIPPLAEYSHFSPHSLKAVITEHNTTSLFVQMCIYGYKAQDVPTDYITFLKQSLPADINFNMARTESSIQPLQRLKVLMNAERNKQMNHKATIDQEEHSMSVDGKVETINDNGLPNHSKRMELISSHLIIGLLLVLTTIH